MKRQEKWKKLGYTEEQIKNHLKYERRKGKDTRERKKRNNICNQEIIKQIKKDLIGNTFYDNRNTSIKVLSISPTTDGTGFYFKIYRIFNDKSKGKFKYFESFDEYNKSKFIKNLNYL